MQEILPILLERGKLGLIKITKAEKREKIANGKQSFETINERILR